MPVEVKPLFHPDAVRPHLKAFQVSLHEDPPKLVSETVHPGYWEKWHADNPRSWGQYAIDWVRPTVWGHWLYESLTPSGRVVVKKFSDGTIRVIYEEPAAGPLINQVLTIEGLRAAAVGVAAKKAATAEAPGGIPDLSTEVIKLTEANITKSGRTVLGSWPGYIAKAKSAGASYFDIGSVWEKLSPVQRLAANRHFLDVIAKNGDQVVISIPKTEIQPGTYLVQEVQYLLKEKGLPLDQSMGIGETMNKLL